MNHKLHTLNLFFIDHLTIMASSLKFSTRNRALLKKHKDFDGKNTLITSQYISPHRFKVQLTQVESHVKIIDFSFQNLKEHIKFLPSEITITTTTYHDE